MFHVKRKGWVFRLSILLVCILMLMPVSAWAADQTYHVPKADFDIVINEDGSANVVETWTLDFEGNTFSRFYKDIFADLPKDEEFSAIEDLQVSIDGVACELTDQPRERPKETYYFEEEADAYRISAFRTSTSVTEYVFSYKLTDVVKNVDQEYNLFVFRPIGAHFEKKVENVNVHFHGPSGSVPEVLYCTKGDSVINGSDVDISAVDCKGMYKIRIRMDGADIPGAINIGSENLTKRDKAGFFDLDSGTKFVITVMGLWVLLIVMDRYGQKIIDLIKKPILQNHPELLEDKLQFLRDTVKPAEVALLALNANFYFYEFARMVQLGKIRLDERNFWLDKDPQGLGFYEQDFYDLVLIYLENQRFPYHTDECYFVYYGSYGQFLEANFMGLTQRRLALRKDLKKDLKSMGTYRKAYSAIKVVRDYYRIIYDHEFVYDIIQRERDPYVLAMKIAAAKTFELPARKNGVNTGVIYSNYYGYLEELNRFHSEVDKRYINRNHGHTRSGGGGGASCGGGGAD